MQRGITITPSPMQCMILAPSDIRPSEARDAALLEGIRLPIAQIEIILCNFRKSSSNLDCTFAGKVKSGLDCSTIIHELPLRFAERRR